MISMIAARASKPSLLPSSWLSYSRAVLLSKVTTSECGGGIVDVPVLRVIFLNDNLRALNVEEQPEVASRRLIHTDRKPRNYMHKV